MAIEVGAAYISILPSTEKLAPAIRKELGGVSKMADAEGKKAGGRFGGGFKKALGGVAGLAATVGFGALVKEAGDAADSITKFKSAMSFAGFNKKEIDAATKRTKKYADETVYDLSEVQRISAQLATNGIKDFAGLTEAAGNLNAVAGGNSETFKSVGMVLTQTAGQGKLTTENWNQLADAIPGASGILQKALKKNGAFTGDFREAMAEGEITAEEFNKALTEVGDNPAARKAATSTQTFEGALGALQAAAVTALLPIMTKVQPVFSKIATFIADKAIPALSDLAGRVSDKVTPVLKDFGGYLRDDVLPVLKRLGEFLVDNKDYLFAAAGGALAAYAALKIYNAYVKIAGTLTLAWNTAQKLLNGTMKLNPIGIVITAIGLLVAGLIIAYKKSDTFRRIVNRAWSGIKKAVHRAWNGTIKPALKQFAGWVRDDLIPVIQRLWRNVVKPAFKQIGKFIAWSWKNVIKPALKALWDFVKNVLWPTIKFLWAKVVKPSFGKLGDFIAGTWKKVIKPAFEALRDGLKTIRKAFKWTVDKIKDIWDGLKGLVAKPVNFIIGTIYNDGLRKALNLIPGVNLGEANKIPGYASGGVLPGYTPGRDVHHFYSKTGGRLALSGGEAIMRPEFTRAMGGSKGIARLNEMARRGQAFKTGGVFNPLPGSHYGTYRGHDGVDMNVGSGSDDYGLPVHAFRSGRISYVGWGRGYGQAVFQTGPFGEVVYGHLSRAAVSAGQSVRGGQVIGNVGSTGNSSAPHLHFGHPGGTYAQAVALLNGASGSSDWLKHAGKSASGSSAGDFAKKWRDAIAKAPGAFKKVWDVITGGLPGGAWAKTLAEAPKEFFRDAVDYGDDKIPNTVKTPKYVPDVPLPDNPIRDALKKLGIYDNGGILEPGGIAFNASNKPEAVFNQQQFKKFAEGRTAADTRPSVFDLHLDRDSSVRLHGYVQDIAEDTYNGERAYAGTTRRMGGR